MIQEKFRQFSFFSKNAGIFSAPPHIVICMFACKGGREMDVDDLIFGDSDPGPSSR